MARGFSFSYENESSEHHQVLFNIWYKMHHRLEINRAVLNLDLDYTTGNLFFAVQPKRTA